MPTTRLCAECGTPLPEGVPDGACPVCAFRGALEPSGAEAEAEALVTEQPGDRIGRYKLLEKIGEGGCGIVYMAEQTEPIRRRVALKIIKLGMDTRQVVARFEAERQALALMDHPNIAKVLDAGATDSGRPFFVMELVKGVRITDYCDKHNLSTGERLDLFMRVCQAVQHAHQKGIIHRDLKPSNILVALQDGVPVPKVIDFGIAKATQQALSDPTSLTSFQQFLGTPAYMSPEQAGLTGLDIDTRSDIYALGVLLYELLTGYLPFEKKDFLQAGLDEMRRLIREQEPPKPSTRLSSLTAADLTMVAKRQRTEPPRLIHGVRGDLDWIVMKCLEKDRARRYETPNGLARDLERHLSHEPVTAAAPSALYLTGKFIRRHRVPLATATALGLLLTAGLVALAVARGFRIERDAARQITALRSADLAARSGQWRQALKYWYEAEAGGYNDQVYLGLHRAEAWTVLAEPARAEVELRRVARRSDLGNQTGPVLLQLGEHELFDAATARQGVEHVREALALGLAGADEPFARGLLAESTPEALDLFHQALRLDSFHHGAHRHSMGLEFVLGHHAELQESFRFFAALYPDDPSAGFLEAAELALHGHLPEAQARLASLHGAVGTAEWMRLKDALPMLAAATKHYDLDVLLTSARPEMPSLELFTATGGRPTPGGRTPLPAATQDKTRMAQLPCLQKGLLEGRAALSSLMLPFLGDIESSVSRIKTSWRRHPEALVPAFAGIYLETRQPTNGPKSIPLLQIQADLFQLAADSHSLLPGLDLTARYLAAKTESELAQAGQTNAAAARLASLANIRRAATSAGASVAELRAYFDLAFKLGDYDLARELIGRWERGQPDDPRALRSRIQLEMAAGAFSPALKLIDQELARNPNESWALAQRKAVLKNLTELMDRPKL